MVAFIVNQIGSLKPAQTTTRLIEACIQRGDAVVVTDVFSLSVSSPRELRAQAVVLDRTEDASRAQICRAANTRKRRLVQLADHEVIMLRTSPGRDIAHAWAHQLALEVAHLATGKGINVVNNPVALRRASSKLYGACLPPKVTPATLVTLSYDEAKEFVAELGQPAVIKPLLGSQGRDVFLIDGPDHPNLRQMCELLGRTGYFLVQEFLPAASEGDMRVIILDGEILTVGGSECVVRRVPHANEFRSNVALGARAHPGTLTDTQRANAKRVGKIIHRDGIRFAGLDVIGDHIVEVNVYSTGGVVDAEEFYQRDFAGSVMAVLCGDVRTVH